MIIAGSGSLPSILMKGGSSAVSAAPEDFLPNRPGLELGEGGV